MLKSIDKNLLRSDVTYDKKFSAKDMGVTSVTNKIFSEALGDSLFYWLPKFLLQVNLTGSYL